MNTFLYADLDLSMIYYFTMTVAERGNLIPRQLSWYLSRLPLVAGGVRGAWRGRRGGYREGGGMASQTSQMWAVERAMRCDQSHQDSQSLIENDHAFHRANLSS